MSEEQNSQKKLSRSFRKLLQERIGKANKRRKNLTQEETNRVAKLEAVVAK